MATSRALAFVRPYLIQRPPCVPRLPAQVRAQLAKQLGDLAGKAATVVRNLEIDATAAEQRR